MRVVAIEKGFRNGRLVRVGDTFEVDAGEKASWWMPVKQEPKPKTEPEPKPKK